MQRRGGMNIKDLFHLTHINANRPSISLFVKSHISKRKKAKTPKMKSRTENQKANNRERNVRRLEGYFSPLKATLITLTLTSMPATKTTTATTTTTMPNPPAMLNPPALVVTTTNTKNFEVCRRRGQQCPLFTKPVPPHSQLESEWLDEDWNGDRESKSRRKRTIAKKMCPITTTLLVKYMTQHTSKIPYPLESQGETTPRSKLLPTKLYPK